MIISLMHIHLAENVKLTSRCVDFWEAVLGFFALLGKSRHLSTIEFNRGQASRSSEKHGQASRDWN